MAAFIVDCEENDSLAIDFDCENGFVFLLYNYLLNSQWIYFDLLHDYDYVSNSRTYFISINSVYIFINTFHSTFNRFFFFLKKIQKPLHFSSNLYFSFLVNFLYEIL